MLSIQDYNDETKLTACLSQSCKYYFNLSLTESSESVKLEIISIYTGGANLNE